MGPFKLCAVLREMITPMHACIRVFSLFLVSFSFRLYTGNRLGGKLQCHNTTGNVDPVSLTRTAVHGFRRHIS